MDTVLSAKDKEAADRSRPGLHPRIAVKHTSLYTLLIALLLCCSQVILLSACGGCSVYQRHKKSDTGSVPVTIQGMEVRPSESELSVSARMTCAYLALMQSLSSGDEESAVNAAGILAEGKGVESVPVEHWFEYALWFLDRKSVNAIPFLRAACRAQPEEPGLLVLYSEALIEYNFTSEALAALDTWIANHPDDTDMRIQQGIILYKTGKPADAAAVFAAVKPEERTAIVDFYHANSLMALTRDKEALVYVREATRKVPAMSEALALQALLCEKLNLLREARQTYEKLLEQLYNRKDVLLRLIVISLKMRQPARALEYYAKGPLDDVFFKLTVGNYFTEFRQFLQAERILMEVNARPDAPAEVNLFLANLAWEQSSNLDEALAWLDRIPDDSEAGDRKLLFKGQLQAEDRRYTDALATARAGRERSPNIPGFVMLECRILSLSGDTEAALATARQGVASWPDSTDMAFQLGSLLDATGHADEAFKVMEDIISRDDSNYHALNYVGYTLANENRDLDRALQLLNRANTLSPGQYFILDSLAWAHFRAGNINEAWDLIREAARADTTSDPEIWEHYGDIAAHKGLRDEARAAWRKALQSPGGKGDRSALRKKLEEQ